MFNGRHDAEQRLSHFLMEDLPVESCAAVPVAFSDGWFSAFRDARRSFMESLGDSIQELALLNLAREDFMGLLMGEALPENLTIKFKRPILYGGGIAADNMFLMPMFPLGMNLDIFMMEQSGAGEIWYPNPSKKVYVSVDMLAGGDGGNATSDRLAQGFAAQMRTGRE